jgi:hypothetical protein
MPLWGKEDKVSARPKFVGLNTDGTLAQDDSGKKLVFLSSEEAAANADKGASGSGWYTVLKTGDRTRLEKLIAISNENRGSVSNVAFSDLHVFNTNADVSADAEPGIEDPNGRPGWYFKNIEDGKKINWYFFDGRTSNIDLSDFSAYAVITLDSTTSRPFLAVYSKPTGSGDAIPGFARSSRVYTWPAGSTAGTKYLVYFGQNPDIHPELPRVQLAAGTTRGAFQPTEKVLTVALNTDSGSAANNVQIVVQNLGINSTAVKADIELRLDASDTLEDSSGLE